MKEISLLIIINDYEYLKNNEKQQQIKYCGNFR
jgi:hypothetical protein